jgi:hypothetical protein
LSDGRVPKAAFRRNTLEFIGSRGMARARDKTKVETSTGPIATERYRRPEPALSIGSRLCTAARKTWQWTRRTRIDIRQKVSRFQIFAELDRRRPSLWRKAFCCAAAQIGRGFVTWWPHPN